MVRGTQHRKRLDSLLDRNLGRLERTQIAFRFNPVCAVLSALTLGLAHFSM